MRKGRNDEQGRLNPADAASCPTRRKSRRDGAASVVMARGQPPGMRNAGPPAAESRVTSLRLAARAPRQRQ